MSEAAISASIDTLRMLFDAAAITSSGIRLGGTAYDRAEWHSNVTFSGIGMSEDRQQASQALLEEPVLVRKRPQLRASQCRPIDDGPAKHV